MQAALHSCIIGQTGNIRAGKNILRQFFDLPCSAVPGSSHQVLDYCPATRGAIPCTHECPEPFSLLRRAYHLQAAHLQS